MSFIRQFAPGVLLMLLLGLIVLGAFVMTLSETGSFVPIISPTELPSPTFTLSPQLSQPTDTQSSEIVLPITSTSITLITPTNPVVSTCNKPDGWVTVFVKEGDSVASLALEYQVSVEKLVEANCIIIENQPLLTDSLIYVPQLSESRTATSVVVQKTPVMFQCGPPPGWIIYTIQKNDNLYRLSLAYGVSVEQLKFANCLKTNLIIVGENIYVPNVPTRTAVYTPIPTITNSLTPSFTPSLTLVPPFPTFTPSQSVTPSRTPTAVPPTVTMTPSPVPSQTPTFTSTSTNLPVTATPTQTSLPSSTFTATPSPIPPSATFTSVPTSLTP